MEDLKLIVTVEQPVTKKFYVKVSEPYSNTP